jgi:hemerythrin
MGWTEEYSVGIDEIDNQHRTLTECLSSIEQALTLHDLWPEVNAAVVQLTGHAQNHFIIEESLMRIHDYPHLPEHADEHQHFLDELKTLRKHSLTNDVSQDRIQSLRKWKDSHVQKHDKAYALYFLKRTALGKH